MEKFDLFLEVAVPSLVGRALSLPGQKFGNIAGLALIVLGTAMVAIAAVRLVRTARNIDQKELRSGTGSRIDVALAGLPVSLGCALFFWKWCKLRDWSDKLDRYDPPTLSCRSGRAAQI